MIKECFLVFATVILIPGGIVSEALKGAPREDFSGNCGGAVEWTLTISTKRSSFLARVI